jgi:hypothetical protein
VVEEANAIGTTYLRAQTLAEPVRTGSLTRLVRYTDTSIRLSQSVPGSPAASQAVADGQQLQRELWPWPDRPWTPPLPPALRACTSRASTR